MSLEQSVYHKDKRVQVDIDDNECGQSNEFMNSSEKHQHGINKYLISYNTPETQANNYYDDYNDEIPQQYNPNTLLPQQSQRERLIEQNIKLKAQIYELAKQLDEILDKGKNKRKKFGTNLNRVEEYDELIREKRLYIKQQQLAIMEANNKIFVCKRQLYNVYNHSAILAKEDEVKSLMNELKVLEHEKEGLMNIAKGQGKALKVVRNNDLCLYDRLKTVREEYGKLKLSCRHMKYQVIDSERMLLRVHEDFMNKHYKLKELYQQLMLAVSKEKTKHHKILPVITQYMLSSLYYEIRQLYIARKEGEKAWQYKIRSVELELQLRRVEEEKKLLMIREKEKYVRLNELKIRELKKLVRGEGKERQSLQDIDMSQFRHKRNIRYMRVE